MQKLPYFEGKRVTLPPYLDNEFLWVTRTRQDSFSKSTLLFDSFFLVHEGQSTYLTKLKQGVHHNVALPFTFLKIP
jgi:hypothetical protein